MLEINNSHDLIYETRYCGYDVTIWHDPQLFDKDCNYILVSERSNNLEATSIYNHVLAAFPGTLRGWDHALSLCEVLSDNRCLTRMWPAGLRYE